ncbi:MAG: hypothetical protein ACRDPO_03510 [Streptosporangiaceae bacterium]
MRIVALLVLALLLPTAAGYALVASVRVSRRMAESRRRPAPVEPADRLAANLRRLRAELEATEFRPAVQAKSHHVRVLRGAYLDALREACARLGVSPPPGGDRARQADIYQAEAALRERGLDVRATAAH